MNEKELQQYFIEECSVTENTIKLGSGTLDRNDYLHIKKIMEANGGKWKGGRISGFVFGSGAASAATVYESLCSGNIENRKKMFQYYPTPDDIADRMVEKLNIREDNVKAGKVLEPSVGRGALIQAVHRKFPYVVIDAYEINPDCYQSLEQCGNVCIHKSDFLESPDDEYYDYIIANPPFAKNADIRHFCKMYSVLKPGGTMCCIVSSHALEVSSSEETEFKTWLYSLSPDIEKLPSGTFKESGTNICSYMITVIKK